MREHVRDDAGKPPPRRAFAGEAPRPARRSPSKSCVHSVVGTSVMPPSSPFGGRVRSEHAPSARTATNAAPRRRRPVFFGALRGNVSASPRRRARAIVHPGAERAGRLLRRADGGAEVHQGLREIAGARGRHQVLRKPPDLRLGRGQFRLDGKQPRHHPLDIAVDRQPPARRRRSPRSPPRYRARCRAARRARPRLPGNVRRGARPRPSRRHADCVRGRSSRARPRACSTSSSGAAASARTSGQRASEAREIGRRPPSRWSAAA